MENKLKKLFEYQRFEQNTSLENLISESEDRFAQSLSDEDLTYVNAAGEILIGGPEEFEGENIWGEGQHGEILLPPDMK